MKFLIDTLTNYQWKSTYYHIFSYTQGDIMKPVSKLHWEGTNISILF